MLSIYVMIHHFAVVLSVFPYLNLIISPQCESNHWNMSELLKQLHNPYKFTNELAIALHIASALNHAIIFCFIFFHVIILSPMDNVQKDVTGKTCWIVSKPCKEEVK